MHVHLVIFKIHLYRQLKAASYSGMVNIGMFCNILGFRPVRVKHQAKGGRIKPCFSCHIFSPKLLRASERGKIARSNKPAISLIRHLIRPTWTSHPVDAEVACWKTSRSVELPSSPYHLLTVCWGRWLGSNAITACILLPTCIAFCECPGASHIKGSMEKQPQLGK